MKLFAKWALINVIVAVLFAACCFAAHKYMVRPTLSVAIWPATGLGIGLIIVWGKRIIPAIALAELINSIVLYQVHEDLGWNKTTLYDFLLWMNNIFRPIFAGFLARYMVGTQPQLIQLKPIAKFFLYACAIPCLISTIFFVMLLAGAGHYTTGDYFIKGFLWYLGDWMSVMIFTPVFMAFFANPRTVWRPRVLNVAIPIMTGFLMVFLLFNSFKSYEEGRINEIIQTHIKYMAKNAATQNQDFSELILAIEQSSDDLELSRYKIEVDEIINEQYFNRYSSNELLTTRYENHVNRETIQLQGAPYRITITPTNTYFSEESSWSLWLAIMIALSFTGFLSVGLLTISGRQTLTAKEVKRRTKQLHIINRELQERNHDYKRIIENQPVIFWKVNLKADQIIFVSQEAEAILGYAVQQWLTEPDFFINRVHPDELQMVTETMLQNHTHEQHIEIEYRIKHANGEYRWFRDVLYIPDDFNETNEVMGMLIDITDKKNDTEKIHHLAFHDYLTQLPNRQKFQLELNKLVEYGLNNNKFGAVVFLDMDRFKVLNDALGHHFGDQLLLKIAGRLNQYDSEFNIMARFGGDEFVLASECEYNNANDAAVQIIMLAEKIIQSLAEPYTINNNQHICTVSMGVTIYPNEHTTVNDIIRQADVAMYRSKDQGRNQVTMYHPSMKKENDKILYIEQVLRNAVSNDSFILKYQPIVDRNQEVVCFESLIRIYADNQTIYPDEFIPVAEDTDLIQPVGRWVISHACLKIMDCQHNISVNVSSKQFHQQGFIMYIDQLMKRFNVGTGRLAIELTEGVVVGNLNEIQYKFQRLKDMGVLIAIDDFGTGYSSLEYLRQLPIDYLKIDKSFVLDLDKDKSSQVIIETIISMAQHLNLQTVAEGVETEKQFEMLKAMGCDFYQGFLFGKPGDLMTIQ
ncbi:MAG: bifunctional diguanylate cyclase/phosphodiesterase [Marinicella sp.]